MPWGKESAPLIVQCMVLRPFWGPEVQRPREQEMKARIPAMEGQREPQSNDDKKTQLPVPTPEFMQKELSRWLAECSPRALWTLGRRQLSPAL